MKNIVLLIAAAVGVSALATSPQHPVSRSIGTLELTLRDKQVQKELMKKTDPIESVTYEKSLDGEMGWVIRTDSCTLETRVERKLLKRIPGHPFGGLYDTLVHAGSCK